MATDINKGRALELIDSIDGHHRPAPAWIPILARAIVFLLARYIDGQ